MIEQKVFGKKMLISQIIAFVIFIITVLLFFDNTQSREDNQPFQMMETDWSSLVDTTLTKWDVLPGHIDSAGTGIVTLSRPLGEHINEKDYIGFFTTFQTVEVKVDGMVIYELKEPQGAISHTPGKVWNFVNLQSTHAGGTITITLTNSYGTGGVSIPAFYFGDRGDIILSFVESQILAIVVSLLMLFVSVVGFIYWIYTIKRKSGEEIISYIVLTIFFMSIWSLLETQVPSLFFGHALFSNQLAFLSLKIANFLQLQFMMIALSLKQDKFMRFLIWASFISFWISLILQSIGWADFMTTSYSSTLIGVLAIAYSFFVVIRLLVRSKRQNAKLQMILRFYVILIVISALFGIVGTVYSYSYNVIDSARYNRLGIMIFLLGMIFLVLNNSVKLIAEGKEAQSIKKEAERDTMTDLKNRAAFDRKLIELSHLPKETLLQYGIVMCDLNNLKMANDNYGHDMGDQYIKTSAGIIQEYFGKYGRAYRIGGDEFCVIVQHLSEEEAKGLYGQISAQIEKMSEAGVFAKHSFMMGIASGYAKFDSDLDADIYATQKRADADMYENKSHMKHRGHNRAEDF